MTTRKDHLGTLRAMSDQFGSLIGRGIAGRDQLRTMSRRRDSLDWAIDELTKDES